MIDIATDPSVGANFVVLVVVRLNEDGVLVGTAHTYTPCGEIVPAKLILNEASEITHGGISIRV